MKRKLFLKALLNFRNLSIPVLLAALTIAGQEQLVDVLHVSNGIVLPAGIGASVIIYITLVLQSLNSKEFYDKVIAEEKRRQLRSLNQKCIQLAYEAKRYVSSAYYARLKKVMDQKNDILNSYMNGEKGYLKGKIVEQTLNLLLTYLKLLINFSKRSKELSSIDISVIANRVNANNRKLSFNANTNAAEDIKRAIEMDEKMIERIKNERLELEKISAKLDYMESMVAMYRQQIISSLESEEMLEKIETAINEADALDTVLEERQKRRFNA
jgi:hypothetical protein